MLQCVDYSNYNNNNEGIIVKLLHLEENYKIIYNLNDKCEKKLSHGYCTGSYICITFLNISSDQTLFLPIES